MWPLKTRKEIAQELADRCRRIRLEQNISQEELAQKAGIALRTYRRFEQEGVISLDRFIAIVHSLSRIAEFENVLLATPIQDLSELENPKTKRERSRKR